MADGSHTVKRAVILAAGKGERLNPVTLKTPKPLIKVNGIRIIDTIINALHKNDIYEIYVVTGYLKEQFDGLKEDFPDIKLIENPYYDSCNNISSLYVARDHLEEAIILDGDQMIHNPDVLTPFFEISGYNASWCAKDTDEWLLEVSDGIIKSCSRTGGKNGYRLYSISRWTAEDGAKLRRYIEEEFGRGNTSIYWDDVPMFCFFKEFRLGIMEIKEEDVTEIDNLYELQALDSRYNNL